MEPEPFQLVSHARVRDSVKGTRDVGQVDCDFEAAIHCPDPSANEKRNQIPARMSRPKRPLIVAISTSAVQERRKQFSNCFLGDFGNHIREVNPPIVGCIADCAFFVERVDPVEPPDLGPAPCSQEETNQDRYRRCEGSRAFVENPDWNPIRA